MIPRTNVKKMLKDQFKLFKNDIDINEYDTSKQRVEYLYNILKNDNSNYCHQSVIKTLIRMKEYTENIEIETYIDKYLYELKEYQEIL